jgi:protein phosphatase
MPTPERPVTLTAASARKPRDDEIDVYGLTHPGKVRVANQDHFLVSALRKHMQVYHSSLGDGGELAATERLAFLAMVADGVGGGTKGGVAARFAVEAVTQYVARSLRCYYTADSTDDASFARTLEDAALECHAGLMERVERDPELRGMATTLTLWIAVWPRAFLLQLGDSRFYYLRNGELTQISRDQTMAQELVDQGVLTRTDAANTRWAHVLSSSLGGQQTAPVVTSMDQEWNGVYLLCSDGLTKHVSDDRIADRLRSMESARQVCEALLQDALDAGGTDNITVIAGRDVKKHQ